MPDIILSLPDEHRGKTKEALLPVLEAEVERFSKWMAELDDPRAKGALSNPERALIKTYLVQKLTGKLDQR